MTFNRLVAITPSDTVNFEKPPDAIYVGTAGVVALVFESGAVVNITAVAGAFLHIRHVKRVNSTSTTATNMLACYSV
jgi:hypothetical protein